MEVEIKVISRETLKPYCPTPSHLKTFTLSFLDQIFPTFHIPVLLFYTTTTKTTPLDIIISTLKTTLTQTLSKFYPLAGRCIDHSNVSCNDEGIPFFETRVNSMLAEFLTSIDKLDVIHKFLPPQDDLAPLSVQINVFKCGGIVIGCYVQHKLLDAASISTFFQYWAALASKRYEDIVNVDPNYDAIVKVFPPCPNLDPALVPDFSMGPLTNSHSVVRNFRFSRVAISVLKGKASGAVSGPTSFETVAGFIWDKLVSTGCITRASMPEATTLSISTNMRPRTNPPLPKESIGNCITFVQAKATRLATFPYLVGKIHGAISKAKLKIEKFQGENGIEEICKDRKETIPDTLLEEHPCVYILNSWCKLGLTEVDFGFGKPNWIVPTNGIIPPSLRNVIFFTDYCDSSGDGIEVWLFLEENEMSFLESNQQFLYYASVY